MSILQGILDIKKFTKLKNLIFELLRVVVFTVISILITRILFTELGAEHYGFIPVFNSANRYLLVLGQVLMISMNRYILVSLHSSESNAQRYYTAAFILVVTFNCVVSAIILLFKGYLIGLLFVDDAALKVEFSYLLIFYLWSFVISNTMILFSVKLFTIEKLSSISAALIMGKIGQFVFLIFSEEVGFIIYGASLVIFNGTSLLLMILLSRGALVNLSLFKFKFELRLVKEVSSTILHNFVGAVGVLLYTTADVIIIGIILGSTFSGVYGVAVQLGLFVSLLGGLVNKVFTPHIGEIVAKEILCCTSSVVYDYAMIVQLVSGLPLLTILFYGEELVMIWLGTEFAGIQSLLIVVSCAQFLHQSTSIYYTLLVMKDKLKKLSRYTLLFGLINTLVSILVLKHTSLGLIGVSCVTLITISIKTIYLNVKVASQEVGISSFIAWKSLAKTIAKLGLFSFAYIVVKFSLEYYEYALIIKMFTLAITFSLFSLILMRKLRVKI